VRQTTAGPAAARNRGLALARGEYIGFLDADDLWTGQHPANALRYLQEHPEVDLVLGQVQCLMHPGGPGAGFVPSGKWFHTYQLGAAIARRETVDRVRGFNPAMRFGEDVDWFLRVRESGAVIATLPEQVLFYRLHAGNQPGVYQNSRIGLLDAFHQALQRRRDSPGRPPSEGNHPLISVIIPVYNGERFIAAAMESVFAQDYRPLELIVVDDGSTDRTREIVRGFPLATLHAQSHEGAGVARNTGVRAGKGEVMAFLDADDLWMQGKLSRQMEALAADPQLEAVFTHVQEFREGGGDADAVARPGPTPGTMLIRRPAFARIGWFDENPETLEGVDWYLRATEKSLRAQMLPDALYRRRVHGENRSIVHRDLNGYVRALKASLDRRRGAARPTAHAQ
jgi:glycosyltransferase involved in cell wall biosynthesis